MKISRLPMNITFMDPSQSTYNGMAPVQSLAMFKPNSNEFHPLGLYSDLIFGRQGDERRDTAMSFIKLKTPVFHPLYFQELSTLKGLYKEILYGTGYAEWDPQLKDFIRSNMMVGETGYAFFMSHWDELKFKSGDSTMRKLRIIMLEKFKDKALTENMTVIPAGLRDVEIDAGGRPVENDINALYRKILSAANTISPTVGSTNTPVLDTPRANLTRNVKAVYDYIFSLLNGKGGVLRSKYARRKVFFSTRNIISPPSLGAAKLGDENQHDPSKVSMGVFQWVKGCEIKVFHAIKHNDFREFFELIDEQVTLTDPKTFKKVEVRLSTDERNKWGTNDGLTKLFNSFVDTSSRNAPILIDGLYLKLIYQDDTKFMFLSDISELPEGFDKSLVRPVTIGEFLYYHIANMVDEVRWFITRHPVTDLDSIYAAFVYLKTTEGFKSLRQFKDGQLSEAIWAAWPDALNERPYYSSMGVYPTQLDPLQGDHDGDQLAATPVMGDESIAEIDKIMFQRSSWLSPTGGLRAPFTTNTTNWLLAQLTGV